MTCVIWEICLVDLLVSGATNVHGGEKLSPSLLAPSDSSEQDAKLFLIQYSLIQVFSYHYFDFKYKDVSKAGEIVMAVAQCNMKITQEILPKQCIYRADICLFS